MTFDQFEKATQKELRSQAKVCFDIAQGSQHWDRQAAKLLEAQFYMQELDRRHDSRITRRDFWLEIAVIGLIVAETVLSIYVIKLAIRESKDEDALMDKQNKVLENLKDSSAATARTMQSVEKTMVTMNQGIHGQLGLA